MYVWGGGGQDRAGENKKVVCVVCEMSGGTCPASLIGCDTPKGLQREGGFTLFWIKTTIIPSGEYIHEV